MRKWFEVRVRELVAPNRWIKKTKFYQAQSGGEAASKYKGSGTIMGVEKVKKEQLLGIGSFFTLGDSLLKEFAGLDVQEDQVPRMSNPKENKKRRYFARQRKEATHIT